MISEFYRCQVLPHLSPEQIFAGIQFDRRARRDWRARCPLHGGENPEAFSVNPQTLVWHCFTACGGGDAIDYVMIIEGLSFVGAIRRLAEIAGVSYVLAGGQRAGSQSQVIGAPISRPPPPPPKRHPLDEVAIFWNRCLPVTQDAEVSSYLQKRCLNVVTMEERDLVRAVPPTGALPWWARYRGEPWNNARQRFRFVVKLFGARGELESVHARALYPQDPKGRDKAAAPAGACVKGLVMADQHGQLLLADSRLGDRTLAVERVRRSGIWIAEGTPDFCTLASEWNSADEDAPAILGIFAGSWTEQLALRIPDGCEVIVATHPDPTGDRFAAGIVATLEPRLRTNLVTVKRWKPRRAG